MSSFAFRSIVRGLAAVSVLVWILYGTLAHGLPPGRHFEMVSEPYKQGYGAGLIDAVAPSGEHVAYTSVGAFAGAPASLIESGQGGDYLARRTALGWRTTPLMAPTSVAPYSVTSDFSSTLEQTLFEGVFSVNTGQAKAEVRLGEGDSEFLLHDSNGPDVAENFSHGGEEFHTHVVYEGASQDLSTAIVSSTTPLVSQANGIEHTAYDFRPTQSGSLHFLGLNNQGQAIDSKCRFVEPGALEFGTQNKESGFNAVLDGGEEIFFWTCGGSELSKQVYVRLNNERTVEVSRKLEPGEHGGCVGEVSPHTAGEVPCSGAAVRPPAEFAGASADGSRVFFTTRAQLVAGDTDTSNNLYQADIGCPASKATCPAAEKEVTGLMRISTPVGAGEAAGVQGVIVINPKADHAYFVAQGILSGQNAEGNSPIKGADNLYAYNETSKSVTFVADLCSQASRSGGQENLSCPSNLNTQHGVAQEVSDEILWNNAKRAEAQTTGDGRFLVFTSYGRLTSDDTDNARDVYRYDDATEKLIRISVGANGFHANGNGEDEPKKANADAGIAETNVDLLTAAAQAELRSRAISEDGSRIIFNSEEPLAPAAINGILNAYEWHEGSVSLVSTGDDEQPVGENSRIAMNTSGSDIFFMTVAKLLSADTDEARDVYDARLNGTGPEFPVPAGSTEPCKSDACQGPLSSPEPGLVATGTATQAPGDNVSVVPAKTTAKASHKTKKKIRRKKKLRAKKANRNRGRR